MTVVIVAIFLAASLGTPAQPATPTENEPIPGEDYPTRPVRLIEPFGLGGGPDLLARALAPKLSELWGQPVIVQNMPGGGATAGPLEVARSPADGYTLLISTSAQAYSAIFAPNLPYDPLNSFIPIAPLSSQPYVLVASRAAGFTTVAELIAAATAKPDELKFASTGSATATHVGVEKFNLEAGISAVPVPATGADAIADVIANTVAGKADYMLAPIPLALQDIRDGKLVALGVSGLRRSSLLENVPTIAEAGVADFDFPIWYGLWAPAGTPAPVVDKVAKDIARVLAAPDMRDWLVKHGSEPMFMTQVEFAQFVLSEGETAFRILQASWARSR